MFLFLLIHFDLLFVDKTDTLLYIKLILKEVGGRLDYYRRQDLNSYSWWQSIKVCFATNCTLLKWVADGSERVITKWISIISHCFKELLSWWVWEDLMVIRKFSSCIYSNESFNLFSCVELRITKKNNLQNFIERTKKKLKIKMYKKKL